MILGILLMLFTGWWLSNISMFDNRPFHISNMLKACWVVTAFIPMLNFLLGIGVYLALLCMHLAGVLTYKKDWWIFK